MTAAKKPKKKDPMTHAFSALYGAAMMGAGLKLLNKFEDEFKKDSGRVSLTLEWGQ